MKLKHAFLAILVLFNGLLSFAQPAVFSARGIGGGGALFFPRINPANDNEFYVACDMSEMFHSTDFGNSYTQLHFTKLQALNVSTYEFTNDAMVAYSNFNDGNNGYPVKTTDGGNTWTKLPGFNAANGEVYGMAANYKNKNQLVMGYYGSIVISNDGGGTFQNIATATSMGSGITMGGVFFDSLNIYVGTNQGIYYSTNGGMSFSPMVASGLLPGQVIWSFAGAKAGSTTRFVCIASAGSSTYVGLMPWDYYGLAKGIYTMDNANGTWVPKAAGITLSNDYVMYAAMAWNDINTIYLAGHDNALSANLVYKSTDGGTTWNKVFKTANNQNIITGWSGQGGDKAWSWGESCFGITVAPYNSNKVMFGDYSFVHVSADGGANWKQAYVNVADQHVANMPTPQKQTYRSIGLENTTCWQVDWQSPTNMMAAFSDIGGIRSSDSGKSWGYTYSGMGVNSIYRIAKTPAGTMFAATSGIHDMYQSTRLKDAQLDANDASGNIMFSANAGATWSTLHSFGHPVFWIAIDPNDSNKMYASVINHAGTGSSGGIWMTSNLSAHAASTWTVLPAPPRTEGHPASIVVLKDGKVLCTYSGRINTSSQFTASSGVFLYNPSTSSWTDVSDANMHYWTKDIVVDPTDATQNTWYAAVFTNWGSTASGQGGLYRTTNRGAAWTKLTAAQFDRVTSVTINPQTTTQAYLTTETQGLWMSGNINAASPTFTLVNSYPFRQPERVYFNPYNQNEMWVTSFGNAMKMGLVTGPSGVAYFSNEAARLVVYPNPATNSVFITMTDKAGFGSAKISVYNTTGQLVTEVEAPNSSVMQIDTRAWPAGLYWIVYDNKTARLVKQ
ncbi:MAG: T9SS type A sorting domain-containing protein [Taibaiella sp.]|nr:T9SS type A sorting domain-containing protein [Taibaiella sp.]